MTEVCLVATEEVGAELPTELLSSPTSRGALSAYELRRPYANAVAVETISLGAAVSLLNDLDWYLTRLVRDALVREPSVDDEEYLSRALATAIRDGDVNPATTGDRLKLYGVAHGDTDGDGAPAPGDLPSDGASGEETEGGETDEAEVAGETDSEAASVIDVPRVPATEQWLVEPLYVTRTGGQLPSYDLRDVLDTLPVRITADEYE